MRKLATVVLGFVLGGSGFIASAAAAPEPQQARTMDQVIDRVITNENRLNQQIRQYSPLVETYIQNLKPDKDLGEIPAGDKYFLGRADFSKGVSLVPLSDSGGGGKKIFGSVGNFFSFLAMQFLPDGFLQMIFIDTNGFDKQHYKFDYVKREFSGRSALPGIRRCRAARISPARAGSSGRIWVEDCRTTTSRAPSTAAYGGGGHSSWYFHFDSWRTNVQPGLWMPSFIYSTGERSPLRHEQEAGLQGADASVGLQHRTCPTGAGAEQDFGRDASERRYENIE